MRSEIGRVLTQNKVNYVKFGDSDRPQDILGRHFVGRGQVISCYYPEAKEVTLLFHDECYEMDNIEKTDVFSVFVPHQKDMPYLFRIVCNNDEILYKKDPYSFPVQIGDEQLSLWEQGKLKNAYRYLGAHKMTINGTEGVHFAVWAPNASRVSVVGDFNNWDGRLHPMIRREKGGIFELFIPDVFAYMKYKFEIKAQNGDLFLKADPFANGYEVAPGNASLIADIQEFEWNDKRWMEERKEKDIYRSPVMIYEVHLGSWRRKGKHGEYTHNYRELAEMLGNYMNTMGYSHLEILGLPEHLRLETVGHEVYGYYAPTSRYGTYDDFKYFVDHLHQRGIGVIVDWSPVGMTKDPSGMIKYDGTSLYETNEKEKKHFMHWQTVPFDYSKKQVCNFLISNVEFWAKEFHIDGIRIASQDSILYEKGYKKNEEGRAFLNEVLATVDGFENGCFVIAEKLPAKYSVDFESVFQWAGDHVDPLIQHLQKSDYMERQIENQEINRFKKMNASEKYIIKISRRFGDTAGAVIAKMPGDYFAKFANMRTLLGFIIGMRGKKYLFMGQEFGQWNDWDLHKSIDWHILKEASNKKLHDYARDLTRFYNEHKVLYETDYEKGGLLWLTKVGVHEVVAFARQNVDTGEKLIFVCNFTPIDYVAYSIGLKNPETYKQIFSSDETKYGGLGMQQNNVIETTEEECDGFANKLTLKLPKQSVIILEKIN